MQLTPTIVVGVGQAGVKVINRLHDSDGLGWGSEYDASFDYIAIDSDTYGLRQTPEKVTRVSLQSPQKNSGADPQAYPYLSGNMDISPKGTRRQRPVGRYKLETGDSVEETVDAITEAATRFAESAQTTSDIPSELNIVHIHSLGGGTGSGTFPFVAAIIDDIVTEIQSEYGIGVYTAGIGIAPKVTPGLRTMDPPGDNRYYANTYAALKDLEKLPNASTNDPLPIYCYSELEQSAHFTSSGSKTLESQWELTGSPYQDYFLVGVDEDRMAKDFRGPESYWTATNNAITAAIYGIAVRWGAKRFYFLTRLGGRGISQKTHIGSFDQAQISVPIEGVREYCELTERIETLSKQVGDDERGTLLEQLRDTQRQRAILERTVDDPTATLRNCDQPEVVAEEIEATLDRVIGTEKTLVEATPNEVDRLIEILEENYGESVLLLALERADDRLTAAEQRRKTAFRELIDAEWAQIADTEKFNLETQTLADRADTLREYLSDERDRVTQKLDESWSRLLPTFDIISFGPDYEQQRDDYLHRLDELEEHRAAYRTVRELRQAVHARREQLIKTRVEPELDRLAERIDDRREALAQKQTELDSLLAKREEKVTELTDGTYGTRLGRLALDEEKLRDDLDQEALAELSSLSAFHREGYLVDNLADIFRERVEQHSAWNSDLLSRRETTNVTAINRPQRTVWMLNSDENADLPSFGIGGDARYDFRRSDDDGVFPSFENPYTVQFLSYRLNSPLRDLEVLSSFKQAVDDGWLDGIIETWADYRFAFAYPEWYDGELYRAFGEEPTELPRLPELQPSSVNINKNGGERKSWISSYGLAAYFWSGDEWDVYDVEVSVDGYENAGWKHYLAEEHALDYTDLRNVAPSGRTASLWYDGELTWENLLEEIQQNLFEEYGITVKLTGN